MDKRTEPKFRKPNLPCAPLLGADDDHRPTPTPSAVLILFHPAAQDSRTRKRRLSKPRRRGPRPNGLPCTRAPRPSEPSAQPTKQ
uniref:Uncharacterized protein n=1 Tax=Oryza rufipogon TaxID=4529 RepID=A0A0E0R5F5_ORYRU